MPENLTSSGPGIAGTMTKISYRAVAGQTGLANQSPFVTDSMSNAPILGSCVDRTGRFVSAWFLAYYGKLCVHLACPRADFCNIAYPGFAIASAALSR